MGLAEPTVFVVDDEPAICSCLRALLQSVGLDSRCFRAAEEFLACVAPAHHGCIILDIRMPGMSGLEVQQRLARKHISMPVIVLTGYADVSTAVRTMKAGAFDMLEKPFNSQNLLDCVWRAIELDSQRKLLQDQRHLVAERIGLLSRRERDVLELVVRGQITREIAANLGLSQKTVENHRARIMDKTQAGGIADLVRMYYTAAGDLQIRPGTAAHTTAHTAADATTSC